MTVQTQSKLIKMPEVLASYIPVCRATFFAGVKAGRYPKPVKIGKRATAWRVSDLEVYVESLQQGAA